MSLVTFDVSDATAGPITSTGLFTNSSDQIYVSHSAVYVLRTDWALQIESKPPASRDKRAGCKEVLVSVLPLVRMVFARALTVLGLVAATTALAQEPKSSPPAFPAPTATPSPGAAAGASSPEPGATPSIDKASTTRPASETPPPTPSPVPFIEDPPLAPGELRIRANRQEGGQGQLRYEGFVDLRFGQLRIQADRLSMIDEPKADGASAQRIEATGNVVFMSGQERISGETLRLDLDTGKGLFTKASGYLQPDVLFEAESIERVDAQTYRLKGAKFTACTQPNPRWMFKAHSATVEIDKKIKATLVGLSIKGVPTPILIPYFQFPINPDQRATGLLMPRYGSSTLKGREIGLGFFWAMGRSMDQTIYYDWYTEYGIGLGHEFRYVRNGASRGNFRSYFTRPTGANKFAYDLDWAASQALPHRFKASLSANFYSDLVAQQTLQDSLDYSSTRTRRGTVGLQGSLGPAYMRLVADTSDVFFFDDSVQRRRHLPQIQFSQSPKKIGKTGIAFGYQATAENLAQGNGAAGETVALQQYSRLDVAPELTRTLSVPFLQVTPKALARYTRYGSSLDENGDLNGPALDRQFFEGSMEVRGPMLFRIFRLPGDVYSDKFKHTFEPELLYTYRSKVLVFDSLPSFDYGDQYTGTNQFLYGVTNRIYAKRTGPTGKPVTHELLTWRLSQTYYVDIGQNQGQFDPNYYSATFARGPGGAPAHKSPIQSNLSIRPTLKSSVTYTTEYNPNFKQFTSSSVNLRINQPRLTLQVGWSRGVKLTDVAANRTPLYNTLRGSGRLALWPERLSVEGSLTYDALRKMMLQSTTRVRYGIQCCGFAVERVNYNTRYRQESKTTFQIELAGIGSIGNFLGDNPANQNNAGRK
jgi:LPS-assembly protein